MLRKQQHTLNARYLRDIGLFLLLLCTVTVNVSAREIDHFHREIENIRDRLNQRVTDRVEENVRRQVRARVRQTVEETIAESIVDNVTEAVTTSAQASLPARPENTTAEVRQSVSPAARTKPVSTLIDIDRITETQLARIEQEVDLILDTARDREGHSAFADEWLVMTDRETLNHLSSEGYIISHVEELNGLGYLLGTLRAPATFDPASISAVQVLDDPQVIVDLNHVYLPQRDDSMARPVTTGSMATEPRGKAWRRIGMIDSGIDHAHPVFEDSRITESSFTPRNFNRTSRHGTAIASILVGQSDAYTGMSPDSSLFNGVVFATDEQGREFSTTAAIVRALNWLAENKVRLINMSLAGPDNAILKQAVQSACAKGITLVTAAGNAGPASPPLYPAAYDCTIAVTAVDGNNTPYHRAGRGMHIDYALPGVDILHAKPDNRLGQSSGTSFAAALLSGMISTLLPATLNDVGEVKRRLDAIAADIGQAGADPIYGRGVIRQTATARISD